MNKMNEIIGLIKLSLKRHGINYDQVINDLGQVKAYEKRQRGDKFSLNEHVKGLILAFLSNQRVWRQIAENFDVLKKIFYNYDSELLMKANYNALLQQIKINKLGNRNINSQILNLHHNIGIFKNIEKEFGSIDMFVESNKVEVIAKFLSDINSKYKMKELGFVLAMEYLKNVGVRTIKPDTHIMRILGPERLGFFSQNETEESAVIKFQKFCLEFGYNQTYLDNLFWTFCAKGYGEICGKIPKCSYCLVRERYYCNYNRRMN